MEIEKVMVVCHGNINRSPLAEAVLKLYAGSALDIRSSGFVNPNRRAAKKMRDAATERGYDLSGHRSQLATRESLLWADLILYMDGGNYKRLLGMLNGGAVNVVAKCLGEWSLPPQKRIPDPAFMRRDSNEFKLTVELIEESARRCVEELIG